MNTTIKIILHQKQQYPTVGNYREMDNGNVLIEISDMKNRYYEFLVSLHEQIELTLCIKRGIPFGDIDEFDESYESSRSKGLALCGCTITKTSEPGMDKHAPYHKEHIFATKIEKQLAHELKVNWGKYDATVNQL